MVSPDKGLISLIAIAVSHEISGNVVKKKFEVDSRGDSTCAGPSIFVTIVALIKPFLSLPPPPLFVCLSFSHCSCNKTMMATGPVPVQNCFGQSDQGASESPDSGFIGWDKTDFR